MSTPAPSRTCPVCGHPRAETSFIPGDAIRDSITATVRQEHPDWSPADGLCLECLNHYRTEHVQEILQQERKELTELDAEVVESIRKHELMAKNLNTEFESQLSFGERLSDQVAAFGGSWRFIIAFLAFMALWMAVNAVLLIRKPFDPYPFILLNLVLSCVAALQAPVIMMSQNRQEEKDRLRAEHDYQVNLKAELEVRNMNSKLDLLLTRQWQRLLEIQQIQTEMMEELLRQREG